MEYFKKDMKLLLLPWLIILPFCTAIGIDLIVFTILKITHAESFFMPGAMVSIFFSALFIPMFTLIYANSCYDLAVSMGRKRKGFMLNAILGTALTSIIVSVILAIYSCLYPLIHSIFFRNIAFDGNFYGFVGFKYALMFSPLVLLIIVAALCFGIIYTAVIRKYNPQIAAILWISFWIIPTLLTRISDYVTAPLFTALLWIVPIGIIIIATVISYMYITKADIKI